MTTILEMEGITKRFPGVLANDHVDFTLEEGEIHALLGENGAGKTTLMNILYGLLRPDEGEIHIRGTATHVRSPLDALAQGIGMVHQHFMLVPTMTVAQNIMLGQEMCRGPFLRQREAIQHIAQVSADFGLDVSPHRPIWQLSVGEQQRVEILKVLYRGAEILILDEPTAAITPPEAEALFSTLRSMVVRGKSVIFITHKLREVMALSHRVTVLRRGQLIGTVETAKTDEEQLAQMMVGRDVVLQVAREQQAPREGKVIASLQQLSVTGNRGQVAVKDLDLDLHAGEIVGVAGVDGNGQSELAEAIAGLRTPERGRVVILGQDMTGSGADERAACGVYYIPADRKARGAVPDLSVAMNSVLKTHRSSPYSHRGILDHRAIVEFAERLVEEYDVRCPSIAVEAKTLSGGNLQKLILARETACQPRLLVAEHPTRGLDVSATEYVRQLLLRQRDAGAAVLLISADLDEVLALSDRIVVVYEGVLNYDCSGDQVDMEKLGLAMAGFKQVGGMPRA